MLLLMMMMTTMMVMMMMVMVMMMLLLMLLLLMTMVPAYRRTCRMMRDNMSAVDELLRAKASLDATDKAGRTLLHFATRAGSMDAVEFLLQHKARRSVVVVVVASARRRLLCLLVLQLLFFLMSLC